MLWGTRAKEKERQTNDWSALNVVNEARVEVFDSLKAKLSEGEIERKRKKKKLRERNRVKEREKDVDKKFENEIEKVKM